MAKSHMDNIMIEEKTRLFTKQLEKEIKDLAKEKKIILLVSEAILVAATNYTVLVQKRMVDVYPNGMVE